MYSFYYEESETWAIWPNQLGLIEFTSSRSEIIITQIFRYFFDGVRDAVDGAENTILDQKTALTTAADQLKAALSDYQTTVEVGDDFVR